MKFVQDVLQALVIKSYQNALQTSEVVEMMGSGFGQFALKHEVLCKCPEHAPTH